MSLGENGGFYGYYWIKLRENQIAGKESVEEPKKKGKNQVH